MISTEYYFDQRNPHKCNNCKRDTPLTITYTIEDIEFELCEDCSNSLYNLHYKTIVDKCDLIYLFDEYHKSKM